MCELPSKIMKSVIIDQVQPDVHSIIVSDMTLAKRNLYNARRKLLPKLPQDRNETYQMLTERQYLTNGNEPFVMKAGVGVILTCLTNLEVLCSYTWMERSNFVFPICIKFSPFLVS
uniref:Uncharacterized protein n=1 Tax=Cacopsylla melanoneura TaxID=428564 RepID=A0A8D8YXV5_9HEMI